VQRTQPAVTQASPISSLNSREGRSPFVLHTPEFRDVLGDAPRLTRVVDTDAHEGPVYLPSEDALLFTSLPRRAGAPHPVVAVRRLALDGARFPLEPDRITTLRADANVANGMALDGQARLIVCEQGTHTTNAAVTREGRVLASSWNGLPLNSPNDVAVTSDGSVWFTDPSYGWLQGFRPQPLLGDNVLRRDPLDGSVSIVAGGFDKPNGLCFSPDERTLYVGDNGAPHRLLAFEVIEERRLGQARPIFDFGPGQPDGLKTDTAGRIYASSGTGANVLTPDGGLMGEIVLPGAVNFCFGTAERNVLFITNDDAIWAAQLAATGPA
jgi:gluconolactonase